MFDHCIAHLEGLFEKGEIDQAIHSTFVTLPEDHSGSTVVIFCVIFGVLFLSIYLMCRFKKTKDSGKLKHHDRRHHDKNSNIDAYDKD